MSSTPIKNLTKNEIEALFHDGSDDEGHPGLSVWDIPLEVMTPHEDQGLVHHLRFTAPAEAGTVEGAAPVDHLLHQGEQLRSMPEEKAVEKVVEEREEELKGKLKRKLGKEANGGGETHSGCPDHTRVPSKTDVIQKDTFNYEGYDTSGSTAAKRKRNRVNHLDAAQDTAGDDNPAPLEQLDGTTEPENAKQCVRQDTSVITLPQRYSSPAADTFFPSIRSKHDTPPTSREVTSQSESHEIPTPASPRRSLRMSNAPPCYLPVKTRPERYKNRDIEGNDKGKVMMISQKKPRHQHPAPSPQLPSPTSDEINDQLSDTDPEKLWCYCRRPQQDGCMVACSYRGCRIEWFHLECFDNEPKPSENDDWFCLEHRGKSSKHLSVVYQAATEAVEDDATLLVPYRSCNQTAFTVKRTADEAGTSVALDLVLITQNDNSDRSRRLAKRRKTGR